LGALDVPSVTVAIQSALEYAAEILVDANDPLSLVGALYVLEGSQNGGIVLKRAYARCLDLDESQLSYFGCYGRDTAAHWRTFRDLLNSLALEDESSKKVVRSAIQCFERLKTICAALYPYPNTGLKHHVTAINFEAGNHAMPQDPLEIALALRAGKTAWEKHPYLEHRFGDRGKRFTHSDSCWLVALTAIPIESVTKNLKWLRTVLASRGIPTAILEAQLRVISQALAVDFPGRVEMQTRFDPFLASLDAERGSFDAERISRLVEEFDWRLRACSGLKVESAAALIASAWADERTGITGAFMAVRDWFTDSERFSNDWIEVVNQLGTTLDHVGTSPC